MVSAGFLQGLRHMALWLKKVGGVENTFACRKVLTPGLHMTKDSLSHLLYAEGA